MSLYMPSEIFYHERLNVLDKFFASKIENMYTHKMDGTDITVQDVCKKVLLTRDQAKNCCFRLMSLKIMTMRNLKTKMVKRIEHDDLDRKKEEGFFIPSSIMKIEDITHHQKMFWAFVNHTQKNEFKVCFYHHSQIRGACGMNELDFLNAMAKMLRIGILGTKFVYGCYYLQALVPTNTRYLESLTPSMLSVINEE